MDNNKESKDLCEDELKNITGGLLNFNIGNNNIDTSLDSLETGKDLSFKPEKESDSQQSEGIKKDDTIQMGVKYHHNLNQGN